MDLRKYTEYMVCMVIAIWEKNLIGVNNTLPGHCKEDLDWFKSLTSNHVIIMGNNTFKSLPKPLNKRLNIVLTRNENLLKLKRKDTNVIYVITLLEAFTIANDWLKDNGMMYDKKIFIIGGKEIYDLALRKNYVDRIYVSQILKPIHKEIFKIPNLVKFKLENHTDMSQWEEIETEGEFSKSENHIVKTYYNKNYD